MTVVSATNQQASVSRTFLLGDGPVAGGNDGTSFRNIATTFAMGNTTRRKLVSTHVAMKCMSGCTGLMKAKIYFLKSNVDGASNSTKASFPTETWTDAQAEFDGAGVIPITDLGQTPYVPGFGRYWKIFKTRVVTLNPGQEFNIQLDTKEDMLFNLVKLGAGIENATMHSSIRNRSYAIMITVEGYPVASANVLEANSVAIGSARLNVMWKWKAYTTQAVHSGVTTVKSINVQDPMIAIAAADQREVNDDDGTILAHMVTS